MTARRSKRAPATSSRMVLWTLIYFAGGLAGGFIVGCVVLTFLG